MRNETRSSRSSSFLVSVYTTPTFAWSGMPRDLYPRSAIVRFSAGVEGLIEVSPRHTLLVPTPLRSHRRWRNLSRPAVCSNSSSGCGAPETQTFCKSTDFIKKRNVYVIFLFFLSPFSLYWKVNGISSRVLTKLPSGSVNLHFREILQN